MADAHKIASGFAPFSPCAERFVANGYREAMTLAEQIAAASKIKGLTAIGLDYPYQFDEAAEIKLRVCSEALVMPRRTGCPDAGSPLAATISSLVALKSIRSICSPLR